MASVYSGAGEGRYGVVPVRGEVEFSLQYNYKAADVEIHVKRCSDLAPVDVKRNRSDPWVIICLIYHFSLSACSFPSAYYILFECVIISKWLHSESYIRSDIYVYIQLYYR